MEEYITPTGMYKTYKVGCLKHRVFPMIVVSKLPDAEFGQNDYREYASQLIALIRAQLFLFKFSDIFLEDVI